MSTRPRPSSASGALASLMVLLTAAVSAPPVRAEQMGTERPVLTARMSRWEGDPVKKRKGPPGFDIQFRLVGSRFDGTFGVEGLPQTVPEGEPFDAQVKLTNIGTKRIRVSSITVVGGGAVLATNLIAKRVEPKSSVTVATFKVPAQSSPGSSLRITVVSSLRITVVLSNGDKHRATLTFSKPA